VGRKSENHCPKLVLGERPRRAELSCSERSCLRGGRALESGANVLAQLDIGQLAAGAGGWRVAALPWREE